MQLDHASAVQCYGQSLELFKEIGDIRRQYTLLGNMALSLSKLNRYDEAEAAMREKFELARDVDPAAAREAQTWLTVRHLLWDTRS